MNKHVHALVDLLSVANELNLFIGEVIACLSACDQREKREHAHHRDEPFVLHRSWLSVFGTRTTLLLNIGSVAFARASLIDFIKRSTYPSYCVGSSRLMVSSRGVNARKAISSRF